MRLFIPSLTLVVLAFAPNANGKPHWVIGGMVHSPTFDHPYAACQYEADQLTKHLAEVQPVAFEGSGDAAIVYQAQCLETTGPGRTRNHMAMVYLVDYMDTEESVRFEDFRESMCADSGAQDIKKQLAELFGSQATTWNLDCKGLEIYYRMLHRIRNDCRLVSFVPLPLNLPSQGAFSVIWYLIKNAKRTSSEILENQTNLNCAKAAALGFKTEFVSNNQ